MIASFLCTACLRYRKVILYGVVFLFTIGLYFRRRNINSTWFVVAAEERKSHITSHEYTIKKTHFSRNKDKLK